MQETALSGRAKLRSYVVVHRGPKDFPVPYIQAYVELEEGPIIYTLVSDCDPHNCLLRLGQDMEMVIDTIREDSEGNEIIAWKFRPLP